MASLHAAPSAHETCECPGPASSERRLKKLGIKLPAWRPLVSVVSRQKSFDSRRDFVNYCNPCLAHDFVLGIRASRTTDCSDNIALFDQWNTASRRNDSIECEQIVEMHMLDPILEDLRRAPKGNGCPRRVFRNLNGSEHRAVHSSEGNQVTTGIGYCYVHFP